MDKKLEYELKTIQNMLITLLKYKCSHLESCEEILKDHRPRPEPIKDLKWEEADKYKELEKEFEESVPNAQ